MASGTAIADAIRELDAGRAAELLAPLDDAGVARQLAGVDRAQAEAILARFEPERRQRIERLKARPAGPEPATRSATEWPEGSVGRLMEPVPAVFAPSTRVSEVLEALRPVVSQTLVTYVYVVDAAQRLLGVVAFRELAFAQAAQPLAEIMLAQPFALQPQTDVIDAMREVVLRHYPVYPVCDEAGRLLGVVRGAVLFEQQAFEISAQAGAMVGVEKEERPATPWPRSLRMRNPWLQVNLLTTFVTATVVGSFQDTINRVVVLAVFLPVLSDQCNNTGMQALAVTLRGLTFGEIESGRGWRLLAKEGWLGFLNGALTGLVAALAMFLLAHHQSNPQAPLLAAITFAALTGSCVLAGVVGAGVPQLLKRLGADPATASSIFLTKATDVTSLGLFLGLAAWLIAR